MKTPSASKLFVTLTLATSLAACAVPPKMSFGGLISPDGEVRGTVESVRVVRIERDLDAYAKTLELRIQPDLRDELVIRLDDGRAFTLLAKSTQRFKAGQRVRVLSDTYRPTDPRVEHE